MRIFLNRYYQKLYTYILKKVNLSSDSDDMEEVNELKISIQNFKYP